MDEPATVVSLQAIVDDWCLDNQFEHISLQESPSSAVPEDAVGSARVCEALQATIWPEISRHEPQLKAVSGSHTFPFQLDMAVWVPMFQVPPQGYVLTLWGHPS
jgi:hypothetical protein